MIIKFYDSIIEIPRQPFDANLTGILEIVQVCTIDDSTELCGIYLSKSSTDVEHRLQVWWDNYDYIVVQRHRYNVGMQYKYTPITLDHYADHIRNEIFTFIPKDQ